HRGPHARRPDSPAVLDPLHAPGERAVRGGVVPRHVRAAVRLAGDRNDYRAGAAVLSAGASHIHSHNQTLIPTDPSWRFEKKKREVSSERVSSFMFRRASEPVILSAQARRIC